jgi:hypothetical protein
MMQTPGGRAATWMVAGFLIFAGAAFHPGAVEARDQGILERTGKGVSELPFSQGRSFATLDEYLDHLKSLGAIDISYYELMPDGKYHLKSAFPSKYPGPTVFTRQELLEKYGFDE